MDVLCEGSPVLFRKQDNCKARTEPCIIICKEKKNSMKRVCGKAVDTTQNIEASPFYVPCEGKGAIKHGEEG
jgi:hypothetical protein